MPALRAIAAAPVVAILVVGMTMAAWPEGPVTGRDRELVARLTRGGVQRFDADGAHWAADALDGHDAGAPAADVGAPGVTLAAEPRIAAAAPSAFTTLAPPVIRLRPGRPAHPPGRDRAPPRL